MFAEANKQRCALADPGHRDVFTTKCTRGGLIPSFSTEVLHQVKMNTRVQSHWPAYQQQDKKYAKAGGLSSTL